MNFAFISFARRGILLFLLLLGGLIFLKFPSAVSAECIITNYPSGCVASTQCGSTQKRCPGTDNITGAECAACVENPTTTSQTCSDDLLDPADNSCPWNNYSENASTGVSCTGDITCSGIYSDGCKYCVVPVCNYNTIQDNGETGINCGGGGCPACPTPTPTPLPAPTLSGGFTGGVACSTDGQTLRYSWNSITGAVRYAIRIDDRTNAWNDTTPLAGDTIDNNVTGTSYSRSSTPGATYDAWVHAVDSRGVYSNASTHSIFTCPVPGATGTPEPTPTSSVPTVAPIPGCVSCGTSGICTGEPPSSANAVSPSCPACPGNTWEYLGDSASATCQANPSISTQYPWCYRCTAALPTPTPDPLATPTPTTPIGVSPSCLNYSAITSPSYRNFCGPGSAPADDDDPNTPPISFTQVNYWTSIRCCDPYLIGSMNCSQVSTDPDYGTWQGSCRTSGGAPTATPITYIVPGIVFIDRNGDGRRQPEGYDRALGTIDDEVGYSGGARLYLGTQNTTTNTTGAYQFTNVTSGDYTLELDVPFGFSPNKSTGWDAATGTNKLSFDASRATSLDFGIVPYEVGVGGTMYTTVDSNCSTSITSQGRLGSKSLSLLENYFGQTFNASTDINGVYSFSAPNQTLFPGSYSLTPSGATGMQLVCAVVDPGTASATYVAVSSTPYTYGDSPGENLTLTAAQPQKRVDFYYKLGRPWFQGKGGDMRIDSGFNDQIPANSYASLIGDGDTPGVIFSGGNAYDFCSGTGNCIDRSSEKSWVVGGTIYPETFTPAIPGTTRTSYGYLSALVRQNGQTITPIPSTINGRNCYAQPGCDLAALTSGVYTNIPSQNDVYTRDSVNNFNGGDYVFLINGNLHIQGKIEVNPNDSALIVSVSGDIKVDKDVGGPPSSSSTHIEGLFSADSDFILESEGTNGDNCPSNEDNRLNMQGAIVVNAQLAGGTFQNNRTLCNNNSDPSVYIEESPYLILNAPDFIKHKSFVWQEVAP